MKPITSTSAPRLISGCRVTNASRAALGLHLAKNPDRREVRAEVERHVPEHDPGFNGRRHHDQGPGLRPVQQRRVVHRVRRPVHDRVLPYDQRRDQDHHQHRAAGVFPPATDEDDGQHHDHDQGADLRNDLPVIESRQEPDRTRAPLDVRVRHARVDVRPRDGGEQPEETEPREKGDHAAPSSCRCARGPVNRPRCRAVWIPELSSNQPSSPKRSTRCELTPSASSVRATRYPEPIHARRVHLPRDTRVPGAPEAAGSILTRSSASLTPRGLSGCASVNARTRVAATSRFTTVTQNSGRLPLYFAAYWSRKLCPIGLPSSY